MTDAPEPAEDSSDSEREAADEGYDEEQWAGTLASANDSFAGESDASSSDSGGGDSGGDTTPLPDLDEVLEKIPATSRELIDTLFRGRFVGVQVIDRKKLY